MKLLGSVIYVTSSFCSFVFDWSLLSTLDSLLFCSFMITPERSIFKLGCSIEIISKSWKNCVWTMVFFCGMINMLGGFCGSRPFFRIRPDSNRRRYKPADVPSAALAAGQLTRMAERAELKSDTHRVRLAKPPAPGPSGFTLHIVVIRTGLEPVLQP